MTPVEVSSYRDLEGDAVASSGEKDRIVQLLQDEGDEGRAFRADEWLWEDKSLEAGRFGTVVAGRVLAETEKAYLVTQLGKNYQDGEISAEDPQTDWVPKSVVRMYRPGEEGVQSTGPQSFLGEYE